MNNSFIAKKSSRRLISRPPSGVPMVGSNPMEKLKNMQTSIRHFHRSYMNATDPKEKAVFASKRDDLLNKITQESFREVAAKFRSLMS